MSKPILMIAIVAAVCCAGWLLTLWRNRRLRQRISELAWSLSHDDLTSLLNRTGLLDRYSDLADRQRSLMSFLIDIDQFKTVNDRFGHAAGDQLIGAVAERIREVAESLGGFAARLSGDEYVAIIEWQRHNIGRIADLFTQAIARPVTITAGGREETFMPSASVGASWADSRDPLYEVTLRQADVAMYHAKRGGGDRYAVYEPGMTMPMRPSRRGPRIRDIHHRHPVGPASIPSVAPQGQPVLSAVRTGAGHSPAEFVVLLDCRDHAHHDRFATMKVTVTGDGTADFSHGIFGMPYRQAMASLAERSGVFPRHDVEVLMLASEPHSGDRAQVFIDGLPAEATSAIHVRAEIFYLDPDDNENNTEIGGGLIRARTFSPAAAGFLTAQLHHRAPHRGDQRADLTSTKT